MACDASLRRLRTDYIDLYQLHWPDRYAPNFGQSVYDPKQERDGTIKETVAALGEPSPRERFATTACNDHYGV